MLKQLIGLLVLALMAFFTYWYVEKLEKEVSSPKKIARSGPDIFMQDVVATVMNEQGKATNKLVTNYLEHFPAEKRTELTSPNLTVHQEDGSIWSIEAETGTVYQGDDQILLNGEVTITKPKQAPGEKALVITTRNLYVDTRRQLAQTQEPVKMSRENITVNANGMHADLQKEQIEFLKDVRGKYVPETLH